MNFGEDSSSSMNHLKCSASKCLGEKSITETHNSEVLPGAMKPIPGAMKMDNHRKRGSCTCNLEI